MRNHLFVIAPVLASLVAAPALAVFSGGPRYDPPPGSRIPSSSAAATTPRQEAERLYGDAYNQVARAGKDLTEGRTRSARKKFKKALDRGERAVELDSSYHEAWNLVGYSARKLGDYDRALAAYDRCLKIKPDYAPAREYLGEAYVELGQIEMAREQLAWLERLEARADAATLKAAIDRWVAAHSEAAASARAATGAAAPADSTTEQ